MACKRLTWDSDHFGFAIARVDSPLTQPSAVIPWCASNAIRCAYLTVGVGDQAGIAWAEKNSFGLFDVRMEFEISLIGSGPAPTLGTATPTRGTTTPTRLFVHKDVPALVRESPALFTHSHFFVDERFPRNRVNRLYEMWMERSATAAPNKTIVVSGPEAAPNGFVTCEIDWPTINPGNGPGSNPPVGKIGLFGVSPRAQGKGIGASLLHDALTWFRSRQAQSVTVVTQGRAVAAQRCYQRAGFCTQSVSLTYHRWF